MAARGPSRRDTARRLAEVRFALADAATEACFRARPELDERYGESGRQRCREDALYHLEILEAAVCFDSPGVFFAYVRWCRELMVALRISADDLADQLHWLADAARRELADEARRPAELLDDAAALVRSEPPPLAPRPPLGAVARDYLGAALAGRRRDAIAIVRREADQGASLRDLYRDVLTPVLREVGWLWQERRISVAQEHLCTATTQLALAHLYSLTFTGAPRHRRFVLTCAPGELHDIGVRMLADVFETEGWDAICLGANTPARDLAQAVRDLEPDLVGLSAARASHLVTLERQIVAIRRAGLKVPVMVGGLAFEGHEDLWRTLGADGHAPDADSALKLAAELTSHPSSGGPTDTDRW